MILAVTPACFEINDCPACCAVRSQQACSPNNSLHKLAGCQNKRCRFCCQAAIASSGMAIDSSPQIKSNGSAYGHWFLMLAEKETFHSQLLPCAGVHRFNRQHAASRASGSQRLPRASAARPRTAGRIRGPLPCGRIRCCCSSSRCACCMMPHGSACVA